MIQTFKPTVFFDLDSVLADFVPAFTRIAVELGLAPKELTSADCLDWKFKFHVDPVWAEVDSRYSFWESLPPLTTDDDMNAMHALASEAHIMYITGRKGKESTARQTYRWLSNWDFPEGPVFFVPPKSDKEGVILPNRHQIIGVLDDKPSILTLLAEQEIPVVARDWPYNRHINVPRVQSVAEFIERLGVRHTESAYLMPQAHAEVVQAWANEWGGEFPSDTD